MNCKNCNGSGHVYSNWWFMDGVDYDECTVCNGTGFINEETQPQLQTNTPRNIIIFIMIIFGLLTTIKCCAQVPVTYGGGNYSTVAQNYIVLEKDTIQGYWTDSTFNTFGGKRQYLFSTKGIQLITEYISGGTIFKTSSLGEYAYWNISRIAGTKGTTTYVNGYNIEGDKVYSLRVENVVLNTFTNIVRGEQNGIPFYLSNQIK